MTQFFYNLCFCSGGVRTTFLIYFLFFVVVCPLVPCFVCAF